jgi:sRNA-binding regulator protein Hfq
MKVRDLAAKSGVPAPVIHRYEAGEEPISQAHLRQFARALIVDTWDIKMVSDPKPRSDDGPPRTGSGQRAERAPKGKPRPAREKKPAPPPAPARASQIEHMLKLAERFEDVDRSTLETQAGKPLEELTGKEAGKLLGQLQERIRQEQPPRVKQSFDRRRPYLPEAVDEFESQYLSASQEAGDTLRVTLFDGSQVLGSIVGFSPYTITFKPAGGEEITVNKLAIAYYLKEETPA